MFYVVALAPENPVYRAIQGIPGLRGAYAGFSKDNTLPPVFFKTVEAAVQKMVSKCYIRGSFQVVPYEGINPDPYADFRVG